ncbi:hypothetical protein FRC11_012487 [Ceratobasidium sp. 423]|nr:hypothetical protein FRC11_012487 [Ceratobasidium sp. 423]
MAPGVAPASNRVFGVQIDPVLLGQNGDQAPAPPKSPSPTLAPTSAPKQTPEASKDLPASK